VSSSEDEPLRKEDVQLRKHSAAVRQNIENRMSEALT